MRDTLPRHPRDKTTRGTQSALEGAAESALHRATTADALPDDIGAPRALILADTLAKLVNLWPASRINQLMPWAYVSGGVSPRSAWRAPWA